MNTITPTPTISPRAGLLLTQLAKTSDFDAALWKLLLDYLDLKVQALETERAALEAKWGMSFGEFQRKIEDNSLGEDVYAFSVEQDYWQWEKNGTLRQYYDNIRATVDVATFIEETLLGLAGIPQIVDLNERTGTTAFALIQSDERIWGIDYDNRRRWHLHPVGAAQCHEPSEPKSIGEIMGLIAAALETIVSSTNQS